jgi:cation diffusion facilitator CzcD-associated flavoprotein CzcO
MEASDLRARYAAERAKRLRPEGSAQYGEPVGRFSTLLHDPYTPRVEREPVLGEVEVAVIGAGFAGLVTGARLRQAGVDDVVLIDGAGDVGGTWYWNRYPGAMCDTAAMIYLPLLEETGTLPSAKYVPAAEIYAHARRIATVFDLVDDALLATQVSSVTWDDHAQRWMISTDRGDRLAARFVTMGTGPLHRPKLPGVPGLERFAGPVFHTCRWDYGVTGGGPDGEPMTALGGKRVGIIGTGATAVQCIPHLARDAGELYVFQRTPSSVDARHNEPIDVEWFASLEPGWQRQWTRNFATLQSGGFAERDLVNDGWTEISRRIRDRVVELLGEGAPLTPATTRRAYEEVDDVKMNEIRARVDALVPDATTAQALKPWYRQLCKRPCFHDEYLQSFNRESVHLVDTDGQGVEAIDEHGVWVAGRRYDLDVLVLASGFEVGTDVQRRSGFPVVGRDGVTLSQAWAEGMVSLHGMHVNGFPNLFVTGFAQGANLISNVTQNLTEAADTVAAVVAEARRRGVTTVEATAEAQAAWIVRIEGSERTMLGDAECTPGYYNNEGGPIGRRERLNGSGFPEGPVAFWEYMDRWRADGEFAGLTMSTRPGVTPSCGRS